MYKLKSVLKSLWANDGVRRVVHTGWVAFAAMMTAGVLPILDTLLKDHNLSAATSAVGALLVAALLAAGTAVRVVVVSLLARRG